MGQWSEILAESERNPASTTTSGKLLAKIPLNMDVEPDPQFRPEKIDKLLARKIQALVEGEIPWPLFLYGRAGTGKTCAARCLLHYVSQRVYYSTITEFCEQMQAAELGHLQTSSGHKKYVTDVWYPLGASSLVVIDELGSHAKVSDFRYQKTKDLIDKMARKPVIYISNLSPSQLGGVYDDRIVSRLCAGTVVELLGKDRRIS